MPFINSTIMSKYLLAAAALVSALNGVSVEGAVELTKENYSDHAKGKNAFIKFLAPW